MIGTILQIYTEMLIHYTEKWKNNSIDQKYQDWIRGEEMKEDLGYTAENFKRIPKRKIRSNASRKKHGY